MADNIPNYLERKFLVELVPIRTTHQSDLRILKTKDGRQFVGKTSKSEVVKWMKEFSLCANHFIPDVPYEGPLEVTLYFGFPLIKSDKGKDSAMTTKPDFDNLAKSMLDTLTKMGFWGDDSQVVFGKVMKFRTKRPFVGVWIKPCNFIDSEYCEQIRKHLNERV
jgi:Holliday junction resolvase RusA-like endonuclease